MKKIVFLLFASLHVLASAQATISFDTYFMDQTLRFDFFHTGDSKTEVFAPDKIYLQGSWAGNPGRCVQPAELGSYRVKVIDIASNNIIYMKGYSTIFSEYQTTGPAIAGIAKTYHESVLVPLPKRPFLLIIEKRDRQNILLPVYRVQIDPADYHINNESVKGSMDQAVTVLKSGDPHHCVDLVILGEGYSSNESGKFKEDLKYYTDLFLSIEPYKSRKNLFNITGIFSPSAESGTDEPREGIYRNTRFGSSFNTFDLDRYCLDEDNKSIRDVAAQVPYDAIIIMVNRSRYGGGGIYNWQTVFNTGIKSNDYVFLHEFGHAFAGLADEYFSSPVAYQDFYTPGVEPLEPNITALPDTADVKWKQFLSPGIKVPTEWGKAKYDSLVDQIAAARASKDAQKTAHLTKALDDFFRNHPLKDKIGVFEGANYMSKGMYRPTLMSLMHKFTEYDVSYKAVNEHAIISIIEYYTAK
jgi:hypothetical protein